jgi:hypothetical protein
MLLIGGSVMVVFYYFGRGDCSSVGPFLERRLGLAGKVKNYNGVPPNAALPDQLRNLFPGTDLSDLFRAEMDFPGRADALEYVRSNAVPPSDDFRSLSNTLGDFNGAISQFDRYLVEEEIN